MMKQKIPCEMIQDILPLYVDELTSEVTNKEVEAHLAECEACRESQKDWAQSLSRCRKRNWKTVERKSII